MKKTTLLLGIFAVCALCACGGGGSDRGYGAGASNNNAMNNVPVTSSVSGKVLDKNGAALSGATVTAYKTNDHTAMAQTTDAGGVYTFTGLSSGDYEIRSEKPGYGFFPVVGNGTGTVAESDYNGLYRTVISLPSLSGASVTGANFTAFHGADKITSLNRTGASTSYAVGDDAAKQKGVAWPGARFADNHNGTVTDNVTGLVWMKNAGCFAPSDWLSALASANALASGICGLTDGSSAGQWRLPNINELDSLIDISQSSPALPAGHLFTNIANIYWSSTTYRGVISEAWTIRAGDGRYMNDGIFNDKAVSLNSLWAVKSGTGGTIKLPASGQYIVYAAGDDADKHKGEPLPSPRFADNADGTVTDYLTGLVWLKKADCINASWSAALAAINALASGQCGLTDNSIAGSWRMPNRNEMVSLGDRVQGNQAEYFNQVFYKADNSVDQAAIFSNVQTNAFYWTSSTYAADITQAWTVFSCDFGIYNILKADAGYSLAVRDYKAN